MLFGLFIVVFAVFHSSKYIEPQIDYGDLKIDGEFIPYMYRGTLIINSQPQYHMVRIQESIAAEYLSDKTKDPVEYARNIFEEKFGEQGWKPSPLMDFGESDCYFLLPESKLEKSFLAFRRDRYEPSYDFYAGDLICLVVTPLEMGGGIDIIMVTAKPTLIFYILEFISS